MLSAADTVLRKRPAQRSTPSRKRVRLALEAAGGDVDAAAAALYGVQGSVAVPQADDEPAAVSHRFDFTLVWLRFASVWFGFGLPRL